MKRFDVGKTILSEQELTQVQQDILATRGLLAMPDLSAYPPAPADTLTWEVRPEDSAISCGWTTYLDGSFRDGPQGGQVGQGLPS